MKEVSMSEINPRLIEMNEQPIVNTSDQTVLDQTSFTLDREWAKQAFLISDNKLGDSDDIKNRYWSSASSKFTDTRIGANIGINSKPQFTRYSDIRDKGRLSGRNDVTINNTSGNFGMGRYYSEAIDDPSQTIYLRFGVPQFNSLTNFIAKAFDANMTSIARTGRAPSVFYDLSKAAGTIAAVVAFPAIAITIVAAKVVGAFFRRPTSKFYTLKPTMHLYWSTVNVLANTIAINKGLLPKILADEEKQKLGKAFVLDQEYLEGLKEILPDMFTSQNFFDMYAIANKAQRLANQLDADDYEALNNGTATDYVGYVKHNITGDGTHATPISDKNNNPTLISRINDMLKFGDYYNTTDGHERSETDPRIQSDGKPRQDEGFFEDYKKNLDAEFRDGSGYAVFKVDHTGSVSESFGSSVGESDLSQKLNSASSDMRQAKFSFADGNITDVPGIVSSAISAAGDVAAGLLDGVTMGFSQFFMGLAGSSYVDVPKYWQSSSASLPKSNYTIQLTSPYGNVISQMQNIYIPLAMLMAGALPLSTGKQSYTSPFICQVFDRGRQQIRLGMIESLSITRGTSNLPFNLKGNALALDVSFSIIDLSSVMHMPISGGSLFEADMTLDEDNILSDYLAVLAGQDIYSQVYDMPKAKLALAKKIMQGERLTSPAYWASLTHESGTSGSLKYLTLGALNALEGLTAGSGVLTRN